MPDGWKHVEEIRPPVFFPPSPPSPSIPCNNPQDCSLYRVGSVLSPLSFLSIESPYSVPPESFPVASETFSWCCIQERIIFEDYIWLQQFLNTSLSNIAVTDDFSLRWHSWSQRMRNKQWEIFQKHPLLGKLTLPGIKGWATNKQWESFKKERFTSEKLTLKLSLSSRREVLPLLQPTVTRHPLNKWTFYSIAYRRMWMTLYKNTFVTVTRHPLKPVDCSLLIVNRKLLQPTVTRHPLEQGQIIGCLLYCLGTYLWLQKNIVSANSYKISLETRTNE